MTEFRPFLATQGENQQPPSQQDGLLKYERQFRASSSQGGVLPLLAHFMTEI